MLIFFKVHHNITDIISQIGPVAVSQAKFWQMAFADMFIFLLEFIFDLFPRVTFQDMCQ